MDDNTSIFACVLSVVAGFSITIIACVYGPPSKLSLPSGTSDEVRIEAYKAWADATESYYNRQ